MSSGTTTHHHLPCCQFRPSGQPQRSRFLHTLRASLRNLPAWQRGSLALVRAGRRRCLNPAAPAYRHGAAVDRGVGGPDFVGYDEICTIMHKKEGNGGLVRICK